MPTQIKLMDKAALITVLTNLINDCPDTDEGKAFMYELTERIVDNYGGKINSFQGGIPLVEAHEDWADAIIRSPMELNMSVADWSIMSGEEAPADRQESYRINIQESDDGVYFGVYPERLDIIKNASGGRVNILGLGVYGKLEIASGLPRVSLARTEDDCTLMITPAHEDGLFIERNMPDGRVTVEESNHSKDLGVGHVFHDDLDMTEVLQEGRMANLAWTLYQSPLHDTGGLSFVDLLKHVENNAVRNNENNDCFRVLLPDIEGREAVTIQAEFHPLQLLIKTLEVAAPITAAKPKSKPKP